MVQGGIAEELSAALQAGAPSFFREDDKTFYRASALLQRAAEAAPGPDSGQLASQVIFRPPFRNFLDTYTAASICAQAGATLQSQRQALPARQDSLHPS